METTTLSPAEALPRICRELAEGRACRLVVTGSSMLPLLRHKKDAVILSAPERTLHRGDILFYLRGENVCVLHRVHRVEADGTLLMCGDAQTALEPIRPEQIIAQVTAVERSGKRMECSALSWRMVSAIWQAMRPLRPTLFRLAAHIK